MKLIIEGVLTPIFMLLDTLISLLPTGIDLPSWLDNCLVVVAKGLSFFPQDVWIICIGNIVFWLGVHMTWAIVEWLYKKLPGIS